MRAQGIDISHYQRAYVPMEHQSFVVIKASDGIHKNYMFEQHLENAADVAYVGAYHYLRSDYDIDEQIARFVDIALHVDFVACDFEGNMNSPSAKFARNAERFCKEVADKKGLPCLLYSSPKYIQEWMFQYGVYWVREYPDLWIAQWPYYGWNDRLLEVPDESKGWAPRLPAGCTEWRMWQYSADGNRQGMINGVTSPDVDLDVFNGSADDMDDWLNKQEPEPEPEVIGMLGDVYVHSWLQDSEGVEIVIRGEYEEDA